MEETNKLNRKGHWLFIRKRLFGLIYVLGFVLSVVGSYQVYSVQVVGAWELITNIINSVIKLFVFSPTISMDKVAPPAYELAIWIAPLGTVLGFFQVFEKHFLRFKQWFRHERKLHLLVMGNKELAEMFLEQLLLDKSDYRLLYIVAANFKAADYLYLEKKGVKVVGLDFDHPDYYENALQIKRYRIAEAPALVCFEAEPQNFGKLTALNRMLSGSNTIPIPAHILSNSEKAKELIEDQAQAWKALDVQFFNLADLRALQLMSMKEFPLYLTKGLEVEWTNNDILSEESISEKIGHVHVLIIGFGKLGQAIFKQATNLCTLNTQKRLHITVVDKNATQRFDFFEAEIEQLEKVCEVDLVNLDVQAKGLPQALSNIGKNNPFTAVVFCLADTQQSLLSYERLYKLFKNARVAVYAAKPKEVEGMVRAIRQKRGDLVCFGSDESILNREVILNDELMQRAKAFNANYNEVAAKLMGWPAESKSANAQWQALNTLKKESSLAQALHRPSKEAILFQLCKLPQYPDSIAELCKLWRSELEGLSTAEQVDSIVKDPVKNYLTELEHRRWNNFHYMRNFHFSEDKDLANKKHDCLIDDWSEFLAGVQRDKAIYDYLSVLSLDK